MDTKTAEAKFIKNQLSVLIGGTITQVETQIDESEGWPEVWPFFIVKTADGKYLQVQVSRDPEGNGPGHLFIDPAEFA